MFKIPNTDEKKLNMKESSSGNEKNDNIKITEDKTLIKTNPTNNTNNININKVKCKSKKPTCNNCGKNKKKKMRLILFDCRCGYKFCNECLLPEKHNCNFDYKKMGKVILEKHNPKVDYEKIIPI